MTLRIVYIAEERTKSGEPILSVAERRANTLIPVFEEIRQFRLTHL